MGDGRVVAGLGVNGGLQHPLSSAPYHAFPRYARHSSSLPVGDGVTRSGA